MIIEFLLWAVGLATAGLVVIMIVVDQSDRDADEFRYIEKARMMREEWED